MRTSKKKIFFLLGFHSEFNMGRYVAKVEKERIQRSMTTRPNNAGIVNKLKPTFGI